MLAVNGYLTLAVGSPSSMSALLCLPNSPCSQAGPKSQLCRIQPACAFLGSDMELYLVEVHQAGCSSTGIFKFLELWEAGPFSAFQHVAVGAGPCRQHRKACGGIGGAAALGNSCLAQSDHLSGRASAGQKNLCKCYELHWHAEESQPTPPWPWK